MTWQPALCVFYISSRKFVKQIRPAVGILSSFYQAFGLRILCGGGYMKSVFKNYLFQKHILVSEKKETETARLRFEILFSLANLFNVRITEGKKLVQKEMIKYVARNLGENVPAPFYEGFPDSVRQLGRDQLLFDQLLHYVVTYGLGNFSEPGHSVFEEQFERAAFNEETEIKEFSVITEEEAVSVLGEAVNHLLAGSRPLSDEQYELVKEFVIHYNFVIDDVASKNTCIRLLADTGNLKLVDFLVMSDVIKLVDELNYRVYQNRNIHQLNLKNQDRKLITGVIRKIFQSGRVDVRTCCEKKKVWCGLLHHIHYPARTEAEKAFCDVMRGKRNLSVYATFEKAMTEKNIDAATEALRSGKGSAAVLRNLNYIISRCETAEEIESVVRLMETDNVIVLLQLLIQYAQYKTGGTPRAFVFTKYNRLKVHIETAAEVNKRRSVISKEQAHMLEERILGNLKKVLKDRLGKVYIDPAMKKYAVPLQENTSQGGYGVLPKGSRIPIPETKKIRAFTYWEKVNDIDLSVFGMDDKGGISEFSWRTMASAQSGAITYSGDQTSGYYGGSEYFDVHLQKFREAYPGTHYLIFCNNVYSRINFSKCFCKAGFMNRDLIDSGEVYEPKAVKSSFLINTDSTFAYLFGIDLKTEELIWLNMARNSSAIVAGTTRMDFLTDYFHLTDIINIYSLFEMMASELVEDPADADVIVTNRDDVKGGENAQVIREYDVEKVIALLG